jgi:hypothetical protein
VHGNTVVFAPLGTAVEHVRNRVDITALSLAEVVSELVIGQFIFLSGSPLFKYLIVEKADAIGFVANLGARLSGAKRNGMSRLTSPDQLYDLELKVNDKRCVVRDLCQHTDLAIEFDVAAFTRSTAECARSVYNIMLLLFPDISRRKDVDDLRKLLGITK